MPGKKRAAHPSPGKIFSLAQRLRYFAKRLPVFYRVRYALITELGGCDFARPPASRMGSLRGHVPRDFMKKVSELKLAGDGRLDDVKKIAFDLSRGHLRGPGLGYHSVETLKRIYSEKAGVCSDYSQVFLGLCEAAGIKAREWGVCAGFEGRGVGHTFNEVYSEQFSKWVFLDPLFSIYAIRRSDGVPLAATELIDLATGGQVESFELKIIEPDWPNRAKREAYAERYLQPGHIFFLLGNNEVFKQDKFLRWSRVVPPPILHMIMILTASYQRYHVYANRQNGKLMAQRMDELRRWRTRCVMIPLRVAAVLLASATLLFVWR